MKPTKSGRKSQVKLTIHPHLLARADALAHERKLSLSELIEDLVRLEISAPVSRSVYAPLIAEEDAHAAERAAAASRFATARPSADASKGAKRG